MDSWGTERGNHSSDTLISLNSCISGEQPHQLWAQQACQNDDQAVPVLVHFRWNSPQETGPAGSFSDPWEVHGWSSGGHARHPEGLLRGRQEVVHVLAYQRQVRLSGRRLGHRNRRRTPEQEGDEEVGSHSVQASQEEWGFLPQVLNGLFPEAHLPESEKPAAW